MQWTLSQIRPLFLSIKSILGSVQLFFVWCGRQGHDTYFCLVKCLCLVLVPFPIPSQEVFQRFIRVRVGPRLQSHNNNTATTTTTEASTTKVEKRAIKHGSHEANCDKRSG